jgi:hypothetical protein
MAEPLAEGALGGAVAGGKLHLLSISTQANKVNSDTQ